MSRFNRKSIAAAAASVLAFGMFSSTASATFILDNTFDVSFSLYRSFGSWTGTGPDQTGGLIFNAGGEGVARPTSPGFGLGDTTAGEIIENRRPFGDLAIGDGVTEFQISASESPDSIRDVRQFDAAGTAVISFDYKFSFRQVLGDGVTPVLAAAIEAQATTPATIKELGLKFFDGVPGTGENRTIVGGLLPTPFTLIADGVVRSVSFTLPVLSPSQRAALDTLGPANNFDLATVFAIVIEGPGGRQFTFDNVDLVQAGPAFVTGDFNFDGGVDASDIDPFVVAANEGDPFAGYIASSQAAFALLYPGQTLTAEIVNQIGDFNGDGGVDASDIDPFVVFANNGGSVSAIPEPALLGLIAPFGLLMARRRR